MASNFKRDKEKAKKAERLVWEVLNNATIDYGFEQVGEVPMYYYRGDIKVLDAQNDECFVEVKDDSRIGGIVNGKWEGTGNVLCEDRVYSYRENKWLKGNMHSNYDYYAVVSQDTKHIYIIDFKVLREIWKWGKDYKKDHYDDDGKLSQKTVGTLCSLKLIERYHGLLYIIEYDEAHNPTNIQKIA